MYLSTTGLYDALCFDQYKGSLCFLYDVIEAFQPIRDHLALSHSTRIIRQALHRP